MSSEVRYKKKDITNLIESGNERELCFLMLYQVYEEGAFSNLVIKKADKIASTMGKNLSFVRAMLYGTLTYSFAIDFLVRHITKEAPEDMDPVSRTIIRMSVWQLQFGNDIPDYAVCDSAVEIAKKYEEEKVVSFLNGILGAFVRAEFPEAAEKPAPEDAPAEEG